MDLIAILNKMIGKTIQHYKILGDELDLAFTDGTKIYNVTKHPHWYEKMNQKLISLFDSETNADSWIHKGRF